MSELSGQELFQTSSVREKNFEKKSRHENFLKYFFEKTEKIEKNRGNLKMMFSLISFIILIQRSFLFSTQDDYEKMSQYCHSTGRYARFIDRPSLRSCQRSLLNFLEKSREIEKIEKSRNEKCTPLFQTMHWAIVANSNCNCSLRVDGFLHPSNLPQ